MPATYLNKVEGAGYIEKYDFIFMPGSGPYEYEQENSIYYSLRCIIIFSN